MAETDQKIKQGLPELQRENPHDAPNPSINESSPAADNHNSNNNPAVRFNSTVQEIAPEHSIDIMPSTSEASPGVPEEVSPDQIRELSQSLQGANLQERRMNIFSFEPVSLPASRTASHDESSRDPSRQHTRTSTSRQSPLLGPKGPEIHSPPLTPAGTDGADVEFKRAARAREHEKSSLDRDVITPQESSQDHPQETSPSPPASARRPPHRHASTDEVPGRESSHETVSSHTADHRKGIFSIGPGEGGSQPVSREGSPSRASAFYTRPFTPGGDANDPYSANKRQPQGHIEPRFVFSRSKKGKVSPTASSISLAKANQDKRHSSLLTPYGRDGQFDDSASSIHSRPGSMADLKRFFKVGAHHKMKRTASPAASVRSGVRTPPSSRSSVQIPFGDDHGLTSKYGKLGRVLGSGAGGSVRLMKRSEDGTVFAVKEFRPRHSYETEREYVKKLTAEYCIGSSLHHGNIIETLDIVQEKGKWFEVMEYAPFDLFAIVMTGKMSREEISCAFLQILSGVTYLHSMGLAHRDMKLDNVVVNEHGIMKIIDFGSAHVFKYPFESNIVLASGIVGSDPYLAPEVYDERKYEPQGVDIWSLAIIFCCMTLRRFPWKVPRMTDNSFKLFAADPTPGHDPRKLILPPNKSTSALSEIPQRDMWEGFERHRDHHKSEAEKEKSHAPSADVQKDSHKEAATGEKTGEKTAEKKEVIRGPWRILRLLPRESRHVIGRMLEIDPKKRAKMPEILEDTWVANTVICRQIEPGKVIKAEDHTHILEPPTPPAAPK